MIELINVTKSFDAQQVLKELSLRFDEGELIVIKGKSGSGKSTLLSLIAGLAKPTSGEIIVDGKHISKLPEHFCSSYRRDNIGMIFQKYNLIETLSVKENILLPLVPLNLSEELLEKRVAEQMHTFNISHKADELIKYLSGGEQQRTAIARAHIADPKIILADEPTANLDEVLSKNFIEMLEKMKSKNKTIIVATHDPLFFELDFVDRIIDFDS
ncbi:MAG: ABC transporter ATP-binding protein [Campylobacterales bacterium]|nr:ABC transporter ATP-binding protein [Campylobacterales bacterium]